MTQTRWKLAFKYFCVLIVLTALQARADDFEDPLESTVKLLNNPTERDQAIKGDSKAEKTDALVKSLSGGNADVANKIYQLSGQVFEKMMKDNNGDPAKIKAALSAAALDPKTFADTQLSGDQRQQVRDLAGQIEKKDPKASP